MNNIEARSGEANNDAKVLYLSPKDARRRAFFILDAALDRIAKRGSETCPDVMSWVDEGYRSLPPPESASVSIRAAVAGMDAEARAALRQRCGLCPARCDRALA